MGQLSIFAALAASLFKVALEWLRQRSSLNKAERKFERVRNKALRARYTLLLKALKARRNAQFSPNETGPQNSA